MGSAAFEKRGVAIDVPSWNSENCIQCNFCSYVCPHAAIRPVAMDEAQAAAAPATAQQLDLTGVAGHKFTMSVSILDCTGCGSCATICPGNKKAETLKMAPLDTQLEEQAAFDYGVTVADKPAIVFAFIFSAQTMHAVVPKNEIKGIM